MHYHVFLLVSRNITRKLKQMMEEKRGAATSPLERLKGTLTPSSAAATRSLHLKGRVRVKKKEDDAVTFDLFPFRRQTNPSALLPKSA